MVNLRRVSARIGILGSEIVIWSLVPGTIHLEGMTLSKIQKPGTGIRTSTTAVKTDKIVSRFAIYQLQHLSPQHHWRGDSAAVHACTTTDSSC